MAKEPAVLSIAPDTSKLSDEEVEKVIAELKKSNKETQAILDPIVEESERYSAGLEQNQKKITAADQLILIHTASVENLTKKQMSLLPRIRELKSIISKNDGRIQTLEQEFTKGREFNLTVPESVVEKIIGGDAT